MSSASELKASGVTVMSLCMSSQPWSGSQGKGLERELFSREMLPLRKKSSSSGLSFPSASIILMVIWNEKSNLWRSNRPKDYNIQILVINNVVEYKTIPLAFPLKRNCKDYLTFPANSIREKKMINAPKLKHSIDKKLMDWILKITSVEFVKTSVTVVINTPFQDYFHPDHHHSTRFIVTPR